MPTKPEVHYETFIRAPAESIWEALTSADFTSKYFHSTYVSSSWHEGDAVVYASEDGKELVTGRVLEADAPHRLSITWKALYDEQMALEKESRVTFEIETLGGVCRLRITHDQFEPGSKTYENVRGGWSAIICSLKSLLETGEPLLLAGNEK